MVQDWTPPVQGTHPASFQYAIQMVNVKNHPVGAETTMRAVTKNADDGGEAGEKSARDAGIAATAAHALLVLCMAFHTESSIYDRDATGQSFYIQYSNLLTKHEIVLIFNSV